MRIGYTTGVFDMFHTGHLNILKRAKENCDRLIVGVTTDELCLSRKGKTPVVSFADRVQIVQAIKYVDEVVPQESMDKMAAQRQYQFNIMFVGSDWQGSAEWSELEKTMAAIGVKIMYFPYTQNISSSKLRPKCGNAVKDEN